jgi:hypothetical protein
MEAWPQCQPNSIHIASIGIETARKRSKLEGMEMVIEGDTAAPDGQDDYNECNGRSLGRS